MRLYSTIDRKVLDIENIKQGEISIYSCGPTVYFRLHIGNIRAYINWDILHRALLYLGYDVKRIMNITDVGHMSSADDFGDDFGYDKLDSQSKKEGLTPMDIAYKYTDAFIDDFRKLNILTPSGDEITENINHTNSDKYGWTRATDYIPEMIEIIKKIESNGYTYETDQAVYFDVTKLPDYTIFTGQNLDEKEVAVRDEVDVDTQKKNPADFVLWMKKVGKYKDHIMSWESPWGVGFPGWHIECTAMGTAILGEHFDIHTGGIDHIPVHHTNERAQNIGAFGHPVVKYWVHNEWLVNAEDSKLSKSKGGASSLPELETLGFDPLDIRYLFASINYRTRLQFSLEAIQGAKNSRVNLENKIKALGREIGSPIQRYIDEFKQNLENNLNMSGVFATLNNLLRCDSSKEDILATVLEFDKVLGLDLGMGIDESIPEEVLKLVEDRRLAKESKNYQLADDLRDQISSLGFRILDTVEGQKVEKDK